MTRFLSGLVISVAVTTTAVVVSAALPRQDSARQRPPNIIFILADDLGYGDLGSYGQQQILTPRLDRMAAEGLRFTQFYAGSTVCAPSRSVLMTGQHTGRTFIRGNARHDLRAEDVTVAERLKQAGYTTALIGKWGLGEHSTGLPRRQGFDYFFGYLNQRHAHNYYPSFLFRNEERFPLNNVVPGEGEEGEGVASRKVDYSHDLLVKEARHWIQENRRQPFFLYLALTIPHANNEAGDQGMEVPDIKPYEDRDWPAPEKARAAMITRMDRDVGSLLDWLAELQIDEQTLVLFSSDNGPHTEGGTDPEFFKASGPLRGIKRDLYEGGIRVPMIARWPGTVAPGRVSDHIGYLGDLMATVADLTKTEPPAGLNSVSFLPTLLGDSGQQKVHAYLYWEFYEQGSAQAVRMGPWKGVRKPMLSGSLELYHLGRDPGEEQDVAGAHPRIVEQILAFMDEAHEPSPLWQLPTAE